MSDFWSRRRAAVEAEARAEDLAQKAALQAEVAAEQAEKTDAELLAEHDLPDPDTLDDAESLRAFLDDAVPARLRTRALRRMWRLNPVLANLDGLLEYGEDYTDAATVVENLQTAYQVGKGMLAHIEEMARQAAEEETREDGLADGERGGASSVVEIEEVAVVEAEVEADPVPAPEVERAIAEPEMVAAAPRRMQFSFEDQSTG